VVAPALLILACSSLITTTANRLSLLLDRVRELTREMEALTRTPGADERKRAFVAGQLGKGSKRAGLLQRTLATLYLALGSLILTSVFVGLAAASGLNAGVIVVTVLASVAFLFYASTLLIRESRIALSSVRSEMAYVRRLTGGFHEEG
jgi:hypothetical protein